MMSPPSPEPDRPAPFRAAPRLLFVASAGAAAVVLYEAWFEPQVGLLALSFIGTLALSRLLSRWRVARVLRSGNLERVLARWEPSLARVPHAETMAPLMRATAFAAHGWVDRARGALRAAQRGPAWEAALEHRLFLDAMLLTFEGDPGAALEQAERLQRMPLPNGTPLLANRAAVLRSAVAALARAFSHQTQSDDRKLLLSASHSSPLVHWAMRYGAAVCAIDDGELGQARKLLSDAPSWPQESCFRRFHREILAELARRAEPAASPEQS